jgi:hypothetical protein
MAQGHKGAFTDAVINQKPALEEGKTKIINLLPGKEVGKIIFTGLGIEPFNISVNKSLVF